MHARVIIHVIVQVRVYHSKISVMQCDCVRDRVCNNEYTCESMILCVQSCNSVFVSYSMCDSVCLRIENYVLRYCWRIVVCVFVILRATVQSDSLCACASVMYFECELYDE